MKKIAMTLLVAGLAVSCSGGRNNTGYSLINDMMYSEAYEAFSENHNYPNGQTNQGPQTGTVARGFMPHPLDADGNPEILTNPNEMTDVAWQRGEKLFTTTCTACHGAEGAGDGLVVTEAGFPRPPAFNSRRFKDEEAFSVGYIYNVISFGFGNMPSHAQQLYPQDRWYVSEFVRQKLMKR